MTAKVTLHTQDGRPVTVRHIRASDWKLLVEMFWQLSSETRWRRFFVPLDHVDPERVEREARRLADIDSQRALALIALVEEEGRPAAVAVARFGRLAEADDCAEASIVIRDDYQGAGLGLQLFDLLVQAALAQNIRHLVLLTHADNAGMLGIVRKLGLPFRRRYCSGLCEIDVQLGDDQQPFLPYSFSTAA